MDNPFIGAIMAFGFNFAPRNWATCDGQLLAISSNTALFSLIGCTFGGDCRTTFALPDLRGRAIKHVGTGPGLNPVSWGERGGVETVSVTVNHMPSHTHTATLHGETGQGTSPNPNNNMLAGGTPIYKPVDANDDKTMNANSIKVQNTGGGIPLDIRNPYLGLYVCIAQFGIFPSRN